MKAINLRRYPILAGLTQDELASESECTASAALEIGTGKRPPRVCTLKQLAMPWTRTHEPLLGTGTNPREIEGWYR